jgi:hypothetical protein
MSTADTRNTFLDGENVVRLISVPTEMEAGIIVGALEEQEIRAAMAGLTTANFRAEAPGRIDILIAEHDLARATQVLETLDAEQGAVDWSRVDVGEPEDGEKAEVAESEEEDYSTSPTRLVVIFSVIAAVIGLIIRFAMTRIAWR